MYIRKASRTYKGKTYSSYLLVESVLTPKGPRQKLICSLGDLTPRPRAQWLALARKLETALTGQQDLFPAAPAGPESERLVAKVQANSQRQPRPTASGAVEPDEEKITVCTDGVRIEESREAGPVHVGYQFWLRLGVDEILNRAGLSERARQITCAMTLNRLVQPASELAMPDWIRSTALEDMLGMPLQDLAEDALYRNLDRLHSRRVEIEAALAERERNLFSLDQTVFLYDLTSTYFEGRALANPKAQRGHSRDSRPDCKHEGQTVVVDRGMSGEENLKKIRARNLHYLVAAQQGERAEWLEEFEAADDFQEVRRETSPQNPFQHKSEIRVKMRQAEGITHVLCLSSERKEKDRAIRQAHEKRLLVDLEKLQKRVAKGKGKGTQPQDVLQSIGRLRERYPRVACYYEMTYDAEAKKFTYALNEAKRTKAEKLDGSYLLKTDRQDLSADEVWRIYILLTRAEAAFRALKSPLAERPIFHRKEGRVEAHIFLCVLAYHLLISIEKTLLNQGVHTSWVTVRDTLRTHQVATVVLPTDAGQELRIRRGTVPEPAHRALYEKLGLPPEIIRPRKEWAVPDQARK